MLGIDEVKVIGAYRAMITYAYSAISAQTAPGE